MKEYSKKKQKVKFNIFFLTIVIYILPIMAIVSFELEQAMPLLALPIIIIWLGFVSAARCAKPFTIVMVINTLLQLVYIFGLLAGIQVHWFFAEIVINCVTVILSFIVFSMSVFSLTKWQGEKMSDLTKKERMIAYQVRTNCFTFMNFMFIFYHLCVTLVMFFKNNESRWIFIWLAEFIIVLIFLLGYTIITRNVIKYSKICED